MTARAILFDLGNTLLHYPWHGRWRVFLRERLEEVYRVVCDGSAAHHVAPLTFVEVAAQTIGGDRAHAREHDGHTWPFADRLRVALTELGMTCDEARMRAVIEAFYEPIGSSTSLYPDTISCLERLRTDGYRLGLVSDTPWDAPGYLCRGDMEKWGIAGYFQAMYFSGDQAWRKPSPRTLVVAAEQLGVELQQCVAIGDMLAREIAAANAAGVPSIWIDRTGEQQPWEGATPDVTVHSLTEAVEAAEGMSEGSITVAG